MQKGSALGRLTPFSKVKDEESILSYPEGTKEENF